MPNFGGTHIGPSSSSAPGSPVAGQLYYNSSSNTLHVWNNAAWVEYAPLASPALTGTPTAPTAAVDTNTTQLATTAYVVGQSYLKSATAASTYQGLDSDLTTLATFTRQTYAASNVTTDRTYNANSTTIDELADVLGSLIADLRTAGLVL